MENSPIKILLIEDIQEDILRAQLMLSDVKGMKYEISPVASASVGLEKLEKESYDAILLNLLLKDNTGLESLLRIQERAPHAPVIILTAKEDQALAFEAVRKGAQDYLVKGKLDGNLLNQVIHYAIERHRVMEEMKKKNEELERLNSMKSEFVSTVSHELRTPLTVVLSASNNLLDGAFGELSQSQKKWVHKINQHAQRLHQMISDILDLSKLQSGKTEIHRNQLDMVKLIKSTVANLKILSKEKKIDLNYRLPDTLPPIWADKNRIDQVLTNLITNAIKFTLKEGTIEVSALESGGFVQVTVSDSGPGIPADSQQAIFDRFRQIRTMGDPASSTKGIGLGLAICREIVTQHSGEIWVESEIGKGAQFTFKLPIGTASLQAAGANILVVDDDEEICKFIEAVLEQKNHRVTIAKNGNQAIQYIDNAQPAFDIVFLDLMLPGANGVEIIKAIHKKSTRPEIVVITAYPNSDLLFEGMAFGPLTIIAKPFDPEAILDMAERKLSSYKKSK